MRKINLLLSALLISALLLFGCASSSTSITQQTNATTNISQTANSTQNQNNSPASKPQLSGDEFRTCKTNADCVPMDCCHSMRCVNSKYAPVCDGVVCSADCTPGSMDCGGGCVCLNNLCEAIAAR